METHRVSSNVYTKLEQLSQDKEISRTDRHELEHEMAKDGLDQAEKNLLFDLDHQLAFKVTDGSHSTPIDPSTVRFPEKEPVRREANRGDIEDPFTPAARRPANPSDDIEDPFKPAGAARNRPTKPSDRLEDPFAKSKAGAADGLIARGLPKQAVMDTFKYLERIGVSAAEIEEIIANHTAKGYDPEDVLGALQAYGVAQDALKHLEYLPEPNKKYLQRVIEALHSGDLRIDAETLDPFEPGTNAVTNSDTNTISYKKFKITNPEHRAIMLHEMIHASHDIEFHDIYGPDQKEVTSGFSETEAYLAQGLYLLEARKSGEFMRNPEDSGTNVILDFAAAYQRHMATEKAVDATPSPTPAQRTEARKAYEAFSKAEDAFVKHLKEERGYAGSFLRFKYADGIPPRPVKH
ncbi:MAG: hypothetical protein ACAI44_14210 [Candidatus Sericytochromatia bacterium]